jgi:hypothetical protein
MEDLRCPPRFGTRRSPDRLTLGPAVGRIAAALGKPLLPHQQYICDVAGEIDPETGRLAYDDVTVVGPRQVTGKTELMLPLMTHRCTGYGTPLIDWLEGEYGFRPPEPGPQKVLYTAQTADLAREKWRDVHVKRIKTSPLASLWAQEPRLRLNAEAMFWSNGSVWSPGSTTGKTAGTGDTLDMPVIDEMWSKEDSRTELGLRPAMMTRPWRQFFRISMVPGLSRALPEKWPYMRQKMETGRTRTELDIRKGVAYFEWSADLEADPHAEDTWWSCMPALGYTVPIENVRADHDQMDSGGIDFQAEYLGWWPSGATPMWLTIKEQTWRDLADPGADYRDPIALGVDATPDLTAASIGMAALRDDGDIHVELIERRPGVNWVRDAVLALCRAHTVCAVGIDRNGPLAGLILPLTRAAIEENLDITIVPMTSAEVSAACATIYNETGEQDDVQPETPVTTRRLHHIEQPELTQAVGGGRKHYHGDRWRWERAEGDATPLYAITLARMAGEIHEWIGGAYDVMESLG